MLHVIVFFFFFNDTATTEIYTLSLHDALPIWLPVRSPSSWNTPIRLARSMHAWPRTTPAPCGCWKKDRKSTRLNSSHANISYAVFCLKKKKKTKSYQYLIRPLLDAITSQLATR